MTEEANDFDRLIAGLRAGDPVVFVEFMDRYRSALERIARRRIDPAIGARVTPESVVQSVCRTFLRRAEGGAFELADGDALWRLLCAMTLTKVRDRRRFHTRQRRSVAREAPPPAGGMATNDIAPDDAAAFGELLEQQLAAFTDEERLVFELRLRGLTQVRIAEELESSERTVRRVLGRIETRLRAALEGA